VHDNAPRGSATLPGCPHGTEENRVRGHFEIRTRRDDESVIPAKLHDCSAEAAMNSLRDI
jgi:hypothetical protein